MPSHATESIIKDLVRLRKRRLIRQIVIANALGVTQSRISQLERLRGSIPLDLVVAYATYLGATISILSRLE
jgi:transcriptional regulator with XRE-family HTH domain